ncbi:hypothetical protein ACFQFH_11055 [Halobaculum halobium]|uniref:hypothetical protein n=1 Tax=Halobaculum halobium TaxID=3032281 RepID=UPI003622D2CE
MSEENDVPLCAKRVFLYPGDPDGTGIIKYDADDYIGGYSEIDFVDSTQFIRSLEEDITLRNRSLLQVTDGADSRSPSTSAITAGQKINMKNCGKRSVKSYRCNQRRDRNRQTRTSERYT